MTVALIIVGVVIGALVLLGLVSVIDRRAREDAVDAARQRVRVERVSSEHRYAWQVAIAATELSASAGRPALPTSPLCIRRRIGAVGAGDLL